MIICFSLASRTSFENLPQKWFREVAHFCHDVPKILVATHADARLDHLKGKEELVPVRDTRNLESKSWQQNSQGPIYIECDARESGDTEAIMSQVRTLPCGSTFNIFYIDSVK